MRRAGQGDKSEEDNRKKDGEESDAAANSLPTDENAAENWRGFVVPPQKRKMSSYLSPCPEWLNVDPSMGWKKVKVKLLKKKTETINSLSNLANLKSLCSTLVHLMVFFRAHVLFVTAFLLKRSLAARNVTTSSSSW